MADPFVEARTAMPVASLQGVAPGAVPKTIERDGYVYLRGAVDPGAIAWVRGEMIAALVEEGLLHSASLTRHGRGEVDTRWTGLAVDGVGIPGRQAQALFKRRRIWETFVEMPGVRQAFEAVAGGVVNFLPISEFRSVAPGGGTPVHQDGTSNYGYEVRTAWFPAMPVDETLGGLAVLPREDGRPYPLLDETADVPAELAARPGWLRADYAPGDMVVFDGNMVHCGLVNRSPDLLRLSMEIRFQGPAAPRPLVGPIVAIAPDSMTIAGEDGARVTLVIDDATRLRGDRFRSSSLIPRGELPGSDLVPGFPVIVAHDEGRAISVRGIF